MKTTSSKDLGSKITYITALDSYYSCGVNLRIASTAARSGIYNTNNTAVREFKAVAVRWKAVDLKQNKTVRREMFVQLVCQIALSALVDMNDVSSAAKALSFDLNIRLPYHC